MDDIISLLPHLELRSERLAVADSPTNRTEQRMKRSELLALAPESYQELLYSNISCAEIRELLKAPTSTPWLYSVFEYPLVADTLAPSVSSSAIQGTRTCCSFRDSTSTTVVSTNTSSGKAIWSSPDLSSSWATLTPKWTYVRGMKPPFIEPTHMLVVISSIPQLPELPAPDASPACVECPVNILIFVLNCPNIKTSSLSRIPRPCSEELPRVSLKLRSTEVLPELLGYLHTKDRQQLFNRLIPDWMYEVIRTVAPTMEDPRQQKRPASMNTVLKVIKTLQLWKGRRRGVSDPDMQDELVASLLDQKVADGIEVAIKNPQRCELRHRLLDACPEGVDFSEALDKVAKNLYAA